MENEEIKERRQALESKKRALLNKLKKTNAQVNYKNYEMRVLQTLLKGKVRPNVKFLRRKLNVLEFKVETEATSLQLERRFMKDIKQTQNELKDALQNDRLFRKLEYLDSDITEATKELDNIERELQETNNEIVETEKQMQEQNKTRPPRLFFQKEKKKKDAGTEKEMNQYMGEIEQTVSLEDICVIKRKDEKR